MSGDDDRIGYEQARRLRATLDAAGIYQGRLWLYYFGLGGNVSDLEVDAYLHHSLTLPRLERDLLALAANEILADMAPPAAPFASDIDEDRDAGADARSETDRLVPRCPTHPEDASPEQRCPKDPPE